MSIAQSSHPLSPQPQLFTASRTRVRFPASRTLKVSPLLCVTLSALTNAGCEPAPKDPVSPEIPDIVVTPGEDDDNLDAGVDASDAAVEAGPPAIDAAPTFTAPDASTSELSSSSHATNAAPSSPFQSTSSGESAPPSFCGDGVLEAGEECDDGNWDVTDGCVQCTIVPLCGNQLIELNEQCDDGNTVATDGCAGCVLVPLCGNGVLEVGEECDTPNSAQCFRCKQPRPRMCGNGVVDSGEECDSDSEACIACRLAVPTCGDGIVNGSEQCDDGNSFENDGCDHLCRTRKCGDGVVQDGEHCDPAGGACRADCTLTPPNCGDGVLQPSEREQCDDGNVTPGDGCFACDIECGNGIVEPNLGELCEPEFVVRNCRASIAEACVACTSENDCEQRDGCNPETCQPIPTCEAPTPSADAGVTSAPFTCDPIVPESPSCDVTSFNLLGNGDFTSDASGWRATDARVSLSHVTADGFAAPGALLVVLDNEQAGGTLETQGADTCIPVDADATYDFRGAYRFLDATWQTSGVTVALFLYNSADCTGPTVSPETTRGTKAPVDVDWTGYYFSVNTDVLDANGPTSMLVKLSLWRSPELAVASVLWDDLTLLERGDAACGDAGAP